MGIKEHLFPYHFIIQWHITERCNWRCKHCYQESEEQEELSFKDLKKIFQQCIDLFEALKIPPNRTYINIGGGEPFLREDFFGFLELLEKRFFLSRVGIMTNGSLITDSVAKDLKKMGVERIQVSLEGLEKTNDEIRGKGSFKKIIKTIRILRKYGLSVRVSLTVTKRNWEELGELAMYLKSIGVHALGARRFVPRGRGVQLKDLLLSPVELRDFYVKRGNLKKELDEHGKFVLTPGCEDGIFYSQFTSQRKHLRSINIRRDWCAVGKFHLTVFVNGKVLACRRLPIVVGDALRETLLEIWFNSDILWKLRSPDNYHYLCRNCPYFDKCFSGAKCISYAYFNKLFMPDPQCWRLFEKLPQFEEIEMVDSV